MTSINYAFNFSHLNVAPIENNALSVIKTIPWRLVGISEDGIEVEARGEVILGAPKDPFIPYADITREQVIAWVSDRIDVNQVQAGIAVEIGNRRNPAVVTLLVPWQAGAS